jgi:hypothetical protein
MPLGHLPGSILCILQVPVAAPFSGLRLDAFLSWKVRGSWKLVRLKAGAKELAFRASIVPEIPVIVTAIQSKIAGHL